MRAKALQLVHVATDSAASTVQVCFFLLFFFFLFFIACYCPNSQSLNPKTACIHACIHTYTYMHACTYT